MTIQISKTGRNVNQTVSRLDRRVGSIGNLLMQAENYNDVYELLNVKSKNLFHNPRLQINQRGQNGSATNSGNPPTGWSRHDMYWFDGWKGQSTSHVFYREYSDYLKSHLLRIDRNNDSVTEALVYAVVGLDDGDMENSEYYTVSFLYQGVGMHVSAFFRDTSSGANIVQQLTEQTGTDNDTSGVCSLPESVGIYKKATFTFRVTGRLSSHKTFNVRFGARRTGTYRVTQLQVEKGRQATPFEFRSYIDEMYMCQKYLFCSQALQGGGVYNGAASFMTGVWFPTEMNSIPTFSMLRSTAAEGAAHLEFGAINIEHDDNYTINSLNQTHASGHYIARRSMVVTVNRSTNIETGQGGMVAIDRDTNQLFTFSCEL